MPKCATPNACDIKSLSPKYVQYFAGVPEKLLGGNCGKCVQVTGAAGTVKAQVIDTFVARGVTINLSQEALKKATGFTSDKKPVSWKFVAC
jgi:expansin (peptidoglycan-binding protein)